MFTKNILKVEKYYSNGESKVKIYRLYADGRLFWATLYFNQGFGSAFFFADPDQGKNLHADPDPGGIRGRGLGVKGKNDFFFLVFFTFQMILNNGCLKSEQKK